MYLVCTAHPKIALGQIVRAFKSITVGELFKRKLDLNETCGAVNYGRMSIMLQLWVKEQIEV